MRAPLKNILFTLWCIYTIGFVGILLNHVINGMWFDLLFLIFGIKISYDSFKTLKKIKF